MQLLQSGSRSARRRARNRRLIFTAVVAAAVAAWFGHDRLLHAYHLWKQQRALAQARNFFAQHDAADAKVALAVAFQAVPGSIDTYRTAAQMLEQVDSPEALRVRRQIVQMMPASAQDHAALVLCALRFRDFNTARDALSTMTPAEAVQPAALNAELAFALDTDNAPMADALFDRLKKLGGDRDDLEVGQAILRLRHPRPAVAGAARAELGLLAQNPKYSLRIHRALASDAMLRRDFAAAEQWSRQVVADPRSNLADRLQQANLKLLVDKRPFDEVFAPLGKMAAARPADAAELVRWLVVQRRFPLADRWIGGLPPAVRNDPLVLSARAEVVAALGDWDRLGPMLEAGAWGPVPRDTVRLAMSAHLVGSHGGPGLQVEVWDQAIESAQGNLSALTVLEQLAAVWKWESESEHTLWAIARGFPDQTWAYQALFNYYRRHNDTADMRDIMALLRDLNTDVPRYEHDWALLSLLLEPTETWNHPKDVLKQLYLGDPGNAFYATSYAFALAQSGRALDALAVVAKMTPQERNYTPRLPYLAYVYGVNHQRPEVEQLEALARNVALLPEERELFVEAHEALDRRTFAPSGPARSIMGGALLHKS